MARTFSVIPTRATPLGRFCIAAALAIALGAATAPGLPLRSLRAATAWSDATRPASGPRTPAVSQVGNSPGPGGSGNTHRKQADPGGRIVMTRPVVPTHAP